MQRQTLEKDSRPAAVQETPAGERRERRQWQAPKGAIVEVAKVTCNAPGAFGNDGVTCNS